MICAVICPTSYSTFLTLKAKHLHELEVVHVLAPRQPLHVDVLVDVQAVKGRLENLRRQSTGHTNQKTAQIAQMR